MNLKQILQVDRGALRNFGLAMGTVAALLFAYLLWKEREAAPYVGGVAVFFLVFGMILPRVLKPIYVGWMTLAHYLSFVMTYIILTVFYFLAIAPVGLAIRLFGGDLLEKRFPGGKNTYWVKAQEYPDDIERYSKPY